MRVRPYIESKDYEYLEKWIDNEKIHAFWCANLIPYPITRESLHSALEKNAADWTGSAYVATENSGEVIGFFCYSVNTDNNSGFLMFVIMDSKVRGKGRGKEMLRLDYYFKQNPLAQVTGIDRLKSQKGVDDNEYYHYDTPLTVEHETQALLEAGFSTVEVLGHWGATYTLKAFV